MFAGTMAGPMNLKTKAKKNGDTKLVTLPFKLKEYLLLEAQRIYNAVGSLEDLPVSTSPIDLAKHNNILRSHSVQVELKDTPKLYITFTTDEALAVAKTK